MRWLEKELHGFRIFVFMIGTLVTYFLYAVVASVILTVFQIDTAIATYPSFWDGSILPVLLLFAWASFSEELLFRAPLSLVPRLGGRVAHMLALAIVSSIIFGYIHGGIVHIFVQGAGGFLFAIVYIKAGGMRGAFFKPFLVSSSTHFLFNFSLFMLAYAYS